MSNCSTEYTVISAYCRKEIIEKIQCLLDQGWTLEGHLIVIPNGLGVLYFHEFIKVHCDSDEDPCEHHCCCKGEKGDKGDPGEKGDHGDDGEDGDKGDK